jgi:hypothetical protein
MRLRFAPEIKSKAHSGSGIIQCTQHQEVKCRICTMVNRAMNFLWYGDEQLPRLENWGVPPDSVGLTGVPRIVEMWIFCSYIFNRVTPLPALQSVTFSNTWLYRPQQLIALIIPVILVSSDSPWIAVNVHNDHGYPFSENGPGTSLQLKNYDVKSRLSKCKIIRNT